MWCAENHLGNDSTKCRVFIEFTDSYRREARLNLSHYDRPVDAVDSSVGTGFPYRAFYDVERVNPLAFYRYLNDDELLVVDVEYASPIIYRRRK